MSQNSFVIETDSVEFDEELYQQNIKENDFSVWEQDTDLEGIGEEKEGDE